MEHKAALGTLVQRAKERHALDVIPVEMRNENVGGKRAIAELALQFLAKHTKAGAAIEDVDLISDAHFHAGGVASVAQVLGLWSGRGAAHAPKLNLHKPRCCDLSYSIPIVFPSILSAVLLG